MEVVLKISFYNHKTVDIRMNVTDIVNQWLSGSISNDGFIVKRSGSVGNLDSTERG